MPAPPAPSQPGPRQRSFASEKRQEASSSFELSISPPFPAEPGAAEVCDPLGGSGSGQVGWGEALALEAGAVLCPADADAASLAQEHHLTGAPWPGSRWTFGRISMLGLQTSIHTFGGGCPTSILSCVVLVAVVFLPTPRDGSCGLKPISSSVPLTISSGRPANESRARRGDTTWGSCLGSLFCTNDQNQQPLSCLDSGV